MPTKRLSLADRIALAHKEKTSAGSFKRGTETYKFPNQLSG